jgi:hypothetical protein
MGHGSGEFQFIPDACLLKFGAVECHSALLVTAAEARLGAEKGECLLKRDIGDRLIGDRFKKLLEHLDRKKKECVSDSRDHHKLRRPAPPFAGQGNTALGIKSAAVLAEEHPVAENGVLFCHFSFLILFIPIRS